jgi:phosphoribosylanthranilate isomerase
MRIKICCIRDVKEAQLAIRAGAHALGLVSRMPSGPGPIDEETIAAVARTLPLGVTSVLLTAERAVGSIVEQHRRCRTNAIQLVDTLAEETPADLKRALPGICVVQVIHVTAEDVLARAVAASEQVDSLLLDSGNPTAATKELGGTGRTHDWSISRRIVRESRCPVFLAGGLRPDNVRQAIVEVEPFGVDVCTGVRTEGRLDEQKLTAFFQAIGRG